jgi:VNT family MFS transporter (synaptic vesicle glycoprotein 2)
MADIDESKLIDGTEVINSSFHHNKTGCQMTFDDDYSAYWVYFINFLGTLAVLPGNIVSALLMDKIGRLSMLGTYIDSLHSLFLGLPLS